MVNISRRLALDHTWIHKPEDVLAIFLKCYSLGKINTKICPGYPLVNSTFLLDEWRSKGCEDLLAVTYMCANNALPIIKFYQEQEEIEIVKEHMKIFILEPFRTLCNYFNEPDEYFVALKEVRSKIAKDYYWDENMEYLEDQILFCLDEFLKHEYK